MPTNGIAREQFRLDKPQILYSMGNTSYRRNIEIGDSIRIFEGVVSDECGDPTHRIMEIKRITNCRASLLLRAFNGLETRLIVDILTSMKSSSEHRSSDAALRYAYLAQERIMVMASIISAEERNIVLPDCVYDHHEALTAELKRIKQQKQIHNEYFENFDY